jgi:hypothetical protein
MVSLNTSRNQIDLKKSMEFANLRITRSAKYDCKTRGFETEEGVMV